MFFRKVYIKVRVFLYAKRRFFNTLAVSAMLLTLFYIFVNSFVFERVVMGKAQDDEINRKYDKALSLYNFAGLYYGLNHFSEDNKHIYFEIPYRKSICYMMKGDKRKSIESMLLGMLSVQKQYGVISKETGYFMRKYLIEFYLNNNNLFLARQEFSNLLIIYRAIGYNDNEMSDIIRLSGDLCYEQKQYNTAMEFYEKAYKEIASQRNIDYEIFSKIVNRICDYQITNGRTEDAVNIYTNAIEIIKASGSKQNELAATMLLRLGDLYSHAEENSTSKKAIPYYEEAITLIRTLPRVSFLRQNLKEYLTILKELYTKDSQYHKVQLIDADLTKMRRFTFLD